MPVYHMMRWLCVASHTGKLSPASWANRGPLLPPHHAGAGATKLLCPFILPWAPSGSLHTWRTRAGSAFAVARALVAVFKNTKKSKI